MRQARLRVFFLSERVRVENAHHANSFGKIVQAFIKLGFQETAEPAHLHSRMTESAASQIDADVGHTLLAAALCPC